MFIMMKVSELARRAGVSADTVRHYTQIGLLKAQRDPANGYQLFDEVALKRLRFVQQARSLGFNLKDIGAIVDQAGHGDSPCPMVRDLLQQKVPETKARIAELNAHLARMEQALARWEAMDDGLPSGHSICCLIEDWEEADLEPRNGSCCHE
jgi:DNA-binding transcriptional MerR regulator